MSLVFKDVLVWCGVLAFLTWVIADSVPAHDYQQPELKSWFMGLKNSQGTPCCDGEDAVHIEDTDWQTVCEAGTGQCHYQVRLEGRWWNVPENSVVIGPNKSGHALVWPILYRGVPLPSSPDGVGPVSDVAIRCFMPGTET
jgi:hypothetical protein